MESGKTPWTSPFQSPTIFSKRLGASVDELSRRALEAFALEEYKAGQITKPESRRLLGLETRYELAGFLKNHGVVADVTLEDLGRDIDDLASLEL